MIKIILAIILSVVLSLGFSGSISAQATPHNGANLAGAEYGGVETNDQGNIIHWNHCAVVCNVVGASASIYLPPTTAGPGWASPWVGIGNGPGFGLAQEGFNLTNSFGIITPQAWYAECSTKTNPGTTISGNPSAGTCMSVILPYTVQTNDLVAMLNTNVGHCQWKMALADYTQHWVWSKTVGNFCMPISAHDAAWVVEGGNEGLGKLLSWNHMQFNNVRYRLAGQKWQSANFNNQEAIYSNIYQHNTTMVKCAIGNAYRNQVDIKWLNPCLYTP